MKSTITSTVYLVCLHELIFYLIHKKNLWRGRKWEGKENSGRWKRNSSEDQRNICKKQTCLHASAGLFIFVQMSNSILLHIGNRSHPVETYLQSWSLSCSPDTDTTVLKKVTVSKLQRTSTSEQCLGSGSGSISQRYGSGSGSSSLHHQAKAIKIVRKTFISIVLWSLYDFFYLWRII